MSQQGQPSGMPGMGAPQGPSPNPPIVMKGFWIFARKCCSQCEQPLDRSWDQCPYCAQVAQPVVAAPARLEQTRTQAFGGDGVRLLGWIVPLQGTQRGELLALSPVTTVGTDAMCTIVLGDKFMSSRHAEIKIENGVWVLRDSGSTNGTYVNNRRIDRQELVDNDVLKFGNAMLKFKSL
jgi:FHA domain-containing protein